MHRFRRLPLIAVLFAVGTSLIAEEHICRYCQDLAALPPGLELDGRYHYAPDRQVDVQHIKLDVTPDFKQRTVTGRASITAKPIARAVQTLRLDAFNLQVTGVSADQAEINEFVSTRDDLRIAFREPIPVGTEFTVHIDYHAQPVQGLYFRTPEMGYPAEDAHIWTQGETHEARHWFPCFDYPNERSSTEIICHVPAGMTVLSNGKRLGEESEPDGMKSVHWLQTKPHANYLICLVAGYFHKLEKQHRDVALGFYTQPSLAEHAENSFEDTPSIMAYYEAEIGVPFPWDKYDQVTIRDFTAGGMENTTLTTLTHRTIFAAETENLRSTRRLDAHEMAHQWFGDYVTCKDWSHLWLNEGFATYYTHLYEGHKYGRDAMLYGLAQDATGILSRKDDKRPIVFNEYKNPMEQFDYRSYPKGSWVLHMLRSQLGADLYRRCIRAYLEKHALSSVVSEDLRQVIEDLSGQPFDRFFGQWVYRGGHPRLKVAYRWLPNEKMARVTVQQTQKVDDEVVLFEFPTKLRFVVAGRPIDDEIRISQEEEDFFIALPAKPTVVRFDPELTVLAEVNFEKSDDLLIAQLSGPDDMIGRLLAAKALGDRKTHAVAEQLSKTLAEDPFYGVRIAAAESLAKHDSDEAFAMLRRLWRQEDARVRETVVERLSRRFHPETEEFIAEVLASEKNPAIVASVLRALGPFHGQPARDRIIEHLDTLSFRNEVALAAIQAIRQQYDPSYKKPLMQLLNDHRERFDSRGFGQGLGALAQVGSTRNKKKDVREFLLRFVNDPQPPVHVAALSALGTLGDAKAIPVLEAFTGSEDLSVSRAARDAVARLRELKPTSPKEVIELRKELAEMKKTTDKFKSDLEAMRKQLAASTEGKQSADGKADGDGKDNGEAKE